jgi:hypothetical protein
MVANCASSRGHIGLTGAPCCCGGGGAGICAQASTLSAPTPRAQRRPNPSGEGSASAFQAYPAIRNDSARLRKPKARPRARQGAAKAAHIAASRGSVTSFPGRRCGGVGHLLRRIRRRSALAGDGDVFVAAGMVQLPPAVLGTDPASPSAAFAARLLASDSLAEAVFSHTRSLDARPQGTGYPWN